MNGADIAFPHLGIYISSLPKGITIGTFTIAYYGIIIACGMVAGLLLARFQARRTGQDPELDMDFVIYGIIFSLIGARLYYVVFSWDSYKDNLWQIFNIRGGGLAIYGGVIAAVITVAVYCRIKKYSFLLFADTASAGLILGQAIGRFGNFMNREAFGEYTDSLFAMRLKTSQVSASSITATMREHAVTDGGVEYIQVHPTFLYESIWNLAVLAVMLAFTGRKKNDGEIFLLYLIGYGAGRVWIEGLRTDQLQIGSTGIAVSQVLSGILVIGGIAVFAVLRIKNRREKSTEPE